MSYRVDIDIENIKSLLNINESELAKSLNIPRSTLYRWKTNENIISKNYLELFYNYIYEQGIYLNNLKSQLFNEYCKENEKLLFHGAKGLINGALSSKVGRDNNDFGQGFYAGENLFQSASFISSYENSSLYMFKYKHNSNLKITEFYVDQEWMLAIAFYRKKLDNYANHPIILRIREKVESSDIVIAPIADNQMYQIIDDFIFGNLTDEQTKHALSATNLGKQYVFLNDNSLNNLELLEHCYLCDKEKKDYLEQKNKENITGIQKVKIAKREFAGKGKYIEEIFDEKI